MDAAELLNVLDIVKHEETYTKRLNEIKEAQKKLDQTQDIVDTIELANRHLERATAIRAQAEKELAKVKNESEQIRNQALAGIADREHQLALKEAEFAQDRQRAEEKFKTSRLLKQQAEEQMAQATNVEKRALKAEKEATEVLNKYTFKIQELQRIMNS